MQSVAVIVQDGAEPFGLGSLVEVWGEPYHPEDDNPVFDFRVCTPRPGRVRGRGGFDLHVDRGLEATEDADLVCFSPRSDFLDFDPAVLDVARAAHDRGAIVYAHCSAAFMLAEAGLLEGKECTTHWRYTDLMAQRYPGAIVRPDVLYVQAGNVLTGAGSAAGIDASLHLVRQTFGARVAATTARRIVVPPHRDGGQAQFIARQVVDYQAETLGAVLSWAQENLAEPLDVDTLARKAHMSPRTFARRFRDETGTTPHAWVTSQRLHLAEEMLERTDNSVDQIADAVGFGNAATLRHHFSRVRGVSPQQYRRQFAC
ncbi:AraC family transcriptional regulator [Nocardioides psychrotolerans]|uniref:Transcriptional regulator GlxA family, contains an amidase domain and an AraC-type DNA-binding HTH domain n=1 Tax=Nocardioides psychrotolerans TaxID=1005945 RepID=A0A1I3FNR2_9ACTN|nr:helix-turn-helix domain-containing protein [Nocardioides psychrotolerans]GEP37230.1 AraC family transcriptional regulator [Nocardioides psychrotolerans]SFI12796.1 Transcriptional regulator GlxA family, contains an amidase domain and an AraC-type DNA-binding HTH domain [Nocardioides psychrotolerans]